MEPRRLEELKVCVIREIVWRILLASRRLHHFVSDAEGPVDVGHSAGGDGAAVCLPERVCNFPVVRLGMHDAHGQDPGALLSGELIRGVAFEQAFGAVDVVAKRSTADAPSRQIMVLPSPDCVADDGTIADVTQRTCCSDWAISETEQRSYRPTATALSKPTRVR